MISPKGRSMKFEPYKGTTFFSIIKKLCFIIPFLFLNRPTSLFASPLIEELEMRYSSVGDPFDNGYSEERYKQVIQHLKKIYSPLIKAQGGVLKVRADWSDGAVNAWASRWGNTYELEIPGGLSRYHLINEAGFMLAICHELGHLLGGEPMAHLISYEGQSDYFATDQCVDPLFQTWEFQPHDSAIVEIKNYCVEQGKGNDPICVKSLEGSLSLTAVFAEPAQKPFPQLLTPSKNEVSETITAHPEPQCRLDTFVAGFFGFQRPACWYAP